MKKETDNNELKSKINSKIEKTENIKKLRGVSRTKKVLLTLMLLIIIIISFITYEIVTVHNTYYIGEKNLQIPILVYHDLVADKSEVKFDYMQTEVTTFESQITGLMKLGYKPISYKDLVDYSNGKKKISKWSFLITFDDGYEGVYKYAYPIAKKYNIPMSTFEIDENVGGEGCFSWQEAKEMHDSGLISVYLHGLQHLEYNKEPTEKLLEQTEQAYKNLTTNLQDNTILKVFTYPYGLYRDEELEALGNKGFIQNLTDNKINQSNKLNLHGLHRCYPLSDSILKILIKIQYRTIRYGG